MTCNRAVKYRSNMMQNGHIEVCNEENFWETH